MTAKLREAVADIIWRHAAYPGATPEQTADKIIRRVRAAVFEALRDPPEEAWGGLAREIVMWMDMYPNSSTPQNLFKHLERCGIEPPQWLRDEPELQSTDHVPSKGTRAVIIYLAILYAMLSAATAAGRDEAGV
jgi:hypothetical protein